MNSAEDEENPEIAAFLAIRDDDKHTDMTTVPLSTDDDAIVEQLLLDELVEDERSGALQVAFDWPDKDTVQKDVNWFGSPWGEGRSEEKSCSGDTSIPNMHISSILRCESDDDDDEMPIELQNINRQHACDMLIDDEIVSTTSAAVGLSDGITHSDLPENVMVDVHHVTHEGTKRVSEASSIESLDGLDIDCWHRKDVSIDTKMSAEEACTSSLGTQIELPNPPTTARTVDLTASATIKASEEPQKFPNECEDKTKSGDEPGDTQSDHSVNETRVIGQAGVATSRKSTNARAKTILEAPEQEDEDVTLRVKRQYESENNGEEVTCKSAAESSCVTEGVDAKRDTKQLTSDSHDDAKNQPLAKRESVCELGNTVREADAHLSVSKTEAHDESRAEKLALSAKRDVALRVKLTPPGASDLAYKAAATPSDETEGYALGNEVLGQIKSDTDCQLPMPVSPGQGGIEASIGEPPHDDSDKDPEMMLAVNLDDESHRYAPTVYNLAEASMDRQMADVKREGSRIYVVSSAQRDKVDRNCSHLHTARLGDESLEETNAAILDHDMLVPQGQWDAAVGELNDLLELPDETNEKQGQLCMSPFALESSPASSNDNDETTSGEASTVDLSDGSPTGAHKRASERKPDHFSQADAYRYNGTSDVTSAGQFCMFKMRNSVIYDALREQQDQMDVIRSKLDAARLEGERLKKSMAAVIECDKPTVTHIPEAPSTAELYALIEAADNQTNLEDAPATLEIEEHRLARLTLAPLREGKSAKECAPIRPAAELFESPATAAHINLEAKVPSVTSDGATGNAAKDVIRKARADAPIPLVHEGAKINFDARGGELISMVFAKRDDEEQTQASVSANDARPSGFVKVEDLSLMGKKHVATEAEINEKTSVACADHALSMPPKRRTDECIGAMYKEQKSSANIEDFVVGDLQHPPFSNHKLQRDQPHAHPVTPRECLWTPKGSSTYEASSSMRVPCNRMQCPMSTSWNDGSTFANDRESSEASNFFQHAFPQGYFKDDGPDVFGLPSDLASSAAQLSSTLPMVSPTRVLSHGQLLEGKRPATVATSLLPRPTNYHQPMPQYSPIELAASSIHQNRTSSNFALPRPQTAPSAYPSSSPAHTYTIQLQRPQPTMEHSQIASLPLPPATVANTTYALASPRAASHPTVWNPMKLRPPPTRAPPTAPEGKLKTVNVTVPREAHIAALAVPALNAPSYAASWSRSELTTRGEDHSPFATPELIL